MNDYQKEQWETYNAVQKKIAVIPSYEKETLIRMAADYLAFREKADKFLSDHFGRICTQKCYESRLSACCSREGIITFFADIVINRLLSSSEETEILMNRLQITNTGYKCIYLGKNGCLWQIKPIVCEMFLCDHAKKEVFQNNPALIHQWEELKKREKSYTFPDHPVLFDEIEEYFLNIGISSSLMYLHNSPGLLRVKKQNQVR